MSRVCDPSLDFAPVFVASAEGGYRYLIVIHEKPGAADGPAPYARAVETADEIVPLLRRVDRMAPGGQSAIAQIYDLTQPWEEQKNDGLALQMSHLPEKTRHDLRVYYETRDAAIAERDAARRWAEQPLLKRLFSAKPEARSA